MRRIRMWGLLAVFLLAASAPAAAAVVSIDAENFPDAKFHDHVTANWDSDHNGTLSDAEIKAVDSADVSSKDIQSLKGIEHFTKLVSLDCWNNRLTSLDVSKNKKLEGLYCHINQMTALDVSKNTALKELACDSNHLTSLDVSKNTALERLWCDNNLLTSLDVSQNERLVELLCSDNRLTALDVSQNKELVELDCNNNRLTSLDVSQNKELAELDCSSNHLTLLDVSQNKELEYLYCQENRLTFLDLQGLNLLSSVDVGGQARDGLKVRKIGSEYVVDLGMFLLSADRFVKVKALAGQAGSTDLVARYDFVSGKARFDDLPDTVTYRYVTGKDPLSMDVRLTTELVSPDVPPTPPTPPSGPGVPPTPPSGPDEPPVTSPVSPESSSGGGGCDAGLSGLALALVGAFLLRKKV